MGRPTQLLLLFFLLLYLLFPSANSTLDAYYYAACIRYGQDLFLPHHLLYNATGYLVSQGIIELGFKPDVLHLMIALNALIAVACLWVLGRILTLSGNSPIQQAAWLAFAGSTFGVWRFATENEVYLLPVLFSLVASWLWLKYLHRHKWQYLVAAGLLAASACLFHQIHVFWWLGLLVGTAIISKSWKATFSYALPALLVPVTYLLVMLLALHQQPTLSGLLQFTLHDFYAGSAGTSIGVNNFLLTGISLVRTFVQVHGLMGYLVQSNWYWILPGLISVSLLVWVLFTRPFKSIKSNKTISLKHRLFARVHALIAILHIGFAWFAVGNAEFMVMLPFLLPILPLPQLKTSALFKLAGALCIWNFCYGIFPVWRYRLSASEELVTLAHQNPDTLFVLDDAVKAWNIYYYKYGAAEPQNIVKSPSARAQRNENVQVLHQLITTQLEAGKPVLTDCISKPRVLSRRAVVSTDSDAAFFSVYQAKPVQQFTTFYGPQQLHRLQQP